MASTNPLTGKPSGPSSDLYYGLSGLGYAMGGIGSYMQGQAGYEAGMYNAQMGQMNAQMALEQGAAAAEMQQIQAKKSIGSMIANYGASGVQVDQGSPLEVLAESARMAELDRLNIIYNAQVKALNYQMQGQLAEQQAKASKTSGELGLATGLLQAGAMIALL